MKLKSVLLVAACAFVSCGNILAQQLVTYPAPDGAEKKKDFVVQVREEGGEWKTLDTYAIKVAKVGDDVKNSSTEKASLSYFDFSGNVEVSVTFNHGTIREGRVRPLSYGIVPVINGNKMTFKLDAPRNLSVEVNGDIFHNLHLFANPIEEKWQKEIGKSRKSKKNPDLIYFGPGLHHLPGDTMNVPSGKTVYLAGGAVVKGCLSVSNARDIKILGRGIIYPEGRGPGISISNSRNIYVEGVVTTQLPTGGSDSVVIRNVKAISSFIWGDGMNIFASSNVLFDGVFCRNSDDCTTVYATRKGFVGSCRNITMQNSTLWADGAHPIQIGLHGNVDHPDVMENLNYVNIDILDHKERQIDYQGCMAITAGDNNMVRNVRFEDIRVEDFRQGQLVNVRVVFNKKYCKAPGMGIENVLFKNISYNGTRADVSMIAGYDQERKVKNVRFENFKVNGEVIYDDMPDRPKWYKTGDMARIFIGEHTEDIVFQK